MMNDKKFWAVRFIFEPNKAFFVFHVKDKEDLKDKVIDNEGEIIEDAGEFVPYLEEAEEISEEKAKKLLNKKVFNWLKEDEIYGSPVLLSKIVEQKISEEKAKKGF